jgi:hypothetical protein
MGEEDNEKYRQTRTQVWSWLKSFIISQDDATMWEDFFEDHGGDEPNPTQINAMETARYLLEKRNDADPDWFNLAGKIIRQVQKRWTLSSLDKEGYVCIGEQDKDMSPYNSHTARYGSILAMYYRAGAPAEFKDEAYHSLCYGLYSVENDGFTCTYFKPGATAWTTDSFGDFLIHYLYAFAAVPEWAGNTNHILGSGSTIKNVVYEGTNRVSYSGFDKKGTDILKLVNKPLSVTVDGAPVKSYLWNKKTKVLEINRNIGSNIIISLMY